jgi:hypothetical protein
LVAAPALRFGTLVHAALEAYWTSRKVGRPADDWAPDMLGVLAAAPGVDPFERGRARAMLLAYAAAWDPVACEVLAVEAEFSLPLRHPETGRVHEVWRLGGKIDALLRLGDGRVVVVDHKTTSDDAAPGGAYRERAVMDGQVSQYFLGAEALGHPPSKFMFDVLRKPSLRPLKATPLESRKYTKEGALYAGQRARDETPDEYEARCAEQVAADPASYLVRFEVPRREAELDGYAADAWAWAAAIDRSEKTGVAPRNPDACFRYRAPCPYHPVCAGYGALEDDGLYRTLAGPHAELSSPGEAAGHLTP